jgi:hypothetical protein
MCQVYTLLRFATWRAFSFWNIVALVTDALLLSAFILRMGGLSATGSQAAAMRLKSFQVLSFVAPFIWYVYFMSSNFEFHFISLSGMSKWMFLFFMGSYVDSVCRAINSI